MDHVDGWKCEKILISSAAFLLNEKDVKLSVNFWNRMMLYVTQVKKCNLKELNL